jgi:hypothetical protein
MTAQNIITQHLAIPTGHIRLLMIASGLRFEIKCPGMRLTSKAPKCSTILRREFGLKGKPESLLSQFEALLVANGVRPPPARKVLPNKP